MNLKKLSFFLGLIFMSGTMLMAQDFEYIGASKCKMCHNKSTTGAQYKVWSEAAHSKAMESLSSEASLKYAAENGIADPTTDPKCIKCHSTAGQIDPALNVGVKPAEGVSCESCHGPGSKYKNMSIMKDQAKAIENGLIVPTEETCKTCHNEENPFHKPFNYEESLKKIAHPNPAKQ